jgi:hypothetical protein
MTEKRIHGLVSQLGTWLGMKTKENDKVAKGYNGDKAYVQ